MSKLTHFSLFSGIGGIDLSAEWAGFTTVGQCEIDNYATKVLEKNFPGVERWRDIRDVTDKSVWERTGIRTGGLTLLSGGFPCQPHSVAGKRKASADERDLWGEFARVIREVRPKWVLGENVRGYCQVRMDGSLDEYCGTWTKWGIMSGGAVTELPKWERCTDGNGCSLLPTPRAGSNRNSRNAIVGQKNGGKHKSDLGLEQAIEVKLGILPKELYAISELPPRFQKLLPTPTKSDYKGGCLRKNSKKQMSNLKEFIYTYADTQTKSIYLNPLFVEEIMGFPAGWTDLNV